MKDDHEKALDELERVKQKIDAERRTLEQVQKEVSDGHRDLQLLVDAINKRNLMLETLDLQLEAEITRRRQEIEVSYAPLRYSGVISSFLFYVY